MDISIRQHISSRIVAGKKDVYKRQDVYHEQTQPLIDYYKKAGALREVDGTVDMEDVFQAIVKVLGE